MNASFIYPLQAAFRAIEAKGLDKIIVMIKLGLKEFPRLYPLFISKSRKDNRNAKTEVEWIRSEITKEALDLSEQEGFPLSAIWEAAYHPSQFSEEELELLIKTKELLKEESLKEVMTSPSSFGKKLRLRA